MSSWEEHSPSLITFVYNKKADIPTHGSGIDTYLGVSTIVLK